MVLDIENDTGFYYRMLLMLVNLSKHLICITKASAEFFKLA